MYSVGLNAAFWKILADLFGQIGIRKWIKKMSFQQHFTAKEKGVIKHQAKIDCSLQFKTQNAK